MEKATYFNYGEYTARDMKAMFRRDGICSAVENVLTLPIREADYSIEPAKGDSGETDFVRSVLMTSYSVRHSSISFAL